MITNMGAKVLALDIMERSTCSVRVGAAIEDKNGRIFSWAWNSPGAGFGEHAEKAAIRRANRERLEGATIYVCSVRSKHGRPIYSKPCEECQNVIDKWGLKVVYRSSDGEWYQGEEVK